MSRDPFSGDSVSVSKVSDLVSVSKDFGLGLEGFRALRLETLHRLFFYELLQEGAP